MKHWSLLLWVTQFGFSITFPVCFFLVLGAWLRQRFALGEWVMTVCGILGFAVSANTAGSCVRTLLREMERNDRKDGSP